MSDSYIVSARKYRPDSFDSIVGQEAISSTLRTAVVSGKVAHAYLFCGPRGVGKTTAARVLAKTINCTSLSPEGEACGACESCRAFAEQRSFNIFELDAASNNSVEDIRTLIEQVAMPPALGRYKVYIIDEVHMLSQAAFNAFLKTLEEPPSYAVFILATTEKHKILPTILSRSQVYDFRRITVMDIVRHLQYVAQSEGIEAEESALGLIAEKADGGMRDALSLFDRIASFSAGQITYAGAMQSLNILDHTAYSQIVEHCAVGDYRSLLLLIDQLFARGFDAQVILSGLASFARDLLVAQHPDTLPLLEKPESVAQLYQQLGQGHSAQALHQAIKILVQGEQQYRSASNKRLLVELTLLNLIAVFRQGEPQGAPSQADPTPQTAPTPTPAATPQAPVTQPPSPRAEAVAPPQPRVQAPTSNAQPATNNIQTPPPPQPMAPPPPSREDEDMRQSRQRFRGLRARAQRGQESAGVEATDEVQGREAFSEESLQKAWMQYVTTELEEDKVVCRNIMQQELPKLIGESIAEVAVVDSSAVLDPIQREVPRIQAYLRRMLNHGGIELRLRPKTDEEIDYVPVTSAERYEHLKTLNPNIERLRDTLKLRLV